jgi:hypothetical protein
MKEGGGGREGARTCINEHLHVSQVLEWLFPCSHLPKDDTKAIFCSE